MRWNWLAGAGIFRSVYFIFTKYQLKQLWLESWLRLNWTELNCEPLQFWLNQTLVTIITQLIHIRLIRKIVVDFFLSFIGKYADGEGEESLSIENTIWCGAVVYTGPECRAAMNNSTPRSKVGLLDWELNGLTKVLFLATVVLSIFLVVL